MDAGAPIRLLFWAREEHPTFRVDIDVLFGRELIGRGHAIDFVMQAESEKVPLGPQPWHGRTVFVGPTHTRGLIGRFAKHWLSFWHDLKSLRLAHKRDYDAIQFRDTFVVAALAAWLAPRRGLKFFYWLSFPYPEADFVHADNGETNFPRLARLRGRITHWLLYRWILPRATHAFVQSDQMKADIVAEGIDPGRLTPVPMGINLGDVPAEDLPPLKPAEAEVVVGYLGALNADRHLETLVDMLALLRGAGHRVRLLLVGDAFDPRDREALKQRAAERDVADHLEITGFLPRLQALARFRETDIAVSPYYPTPMFLSTSPTKLVEYLALSLPVVASQHPEQRSILRESGAGVCSPWGARHFARSVAFLLRRTPEERRRMGAAGRDWVTTHRSYARIADDLEREYRRFLRPTGTAEVSRDH